MLFWISFCIISLIYFSIYFPLEILWCMISLHTENSICHIWFQLHRENDIYGKICIKVFSSKKWVVSHNLFRCFPCTVETLVYIWRLSERLSSIISWMTLVLMTLFTVTPWQFSLCKHKILHVNMVSFDQTKFAEENRGNKFNFFSLNIEE